MKTAGMNASLYDQIVFLVIETLSKRDEFDDKTLERLRELAESGGLVKPERVASALRTREET